MTQKATEDFTLEITGDDIASVAPNVGGEFQRFQHGDYKFKIVDAEQVAKEGEKPHVMIKVHFSCMHAYDSAKAGEVGQQISGLYAGSLQSPKMMQARLANLIKACKLNLAKDAKLSRSALIGREVDASVIWTLGKPKMDPETGGMKPAPVFANLIAERAVGEQRPVGVDPERDSRPATRHLEQQYGETELPGEAPEVQPWAQTATASTAATAQTETETVATWRPDSEGDANLHEYRAHIKLSTPHAQMAREGLVASGFDPDGPVDAHQLGDVKAAYLAAFPAKAAGGLPGLPGLGAPAPAANGAKKGVRQPRT